MSRRWTSTLFTASALVVIPALAPAADEPAGPSAEHATLFRQLDKNTDGKLSRDEVPEEQQRLVERLIANHDADQDGKLSLDEFSKGLKESRPRGEGAPAPGGPGGRGPGEGGEFFRQLDKNGDGKLTPDEAPAGREEFFKQRLQQADTDKDGAASREEFLKLMMAARPDGQPRPQPGQPARPDQPRPEGERRPDQPPQGGPYPPRGPGDELTRALDSDKDGVISSAEIEKAAASLKSLDKNGDGKLTREELGPPGPRPDGPRPGEGGFRPDGERFVAYMLQMDKNGDKKLSKDEAPERMKENFDRIDRNSDGFIDEAELKQMAAMIGQRPPGAPGEPGRRPEGGPRPDGAKPEGGDRPRRPEGAGPDARREGDKSASDRRPDERKPDGDAKPRREGDKPASDLRPDDRKPTEKNEKPKKDDGAPSKD